MYKKLVLGDALELIKEIPENSVDLILTDPPYNTGNYNTGQIKFKTRKDMNKTSDWDFNFKPEVYVEDFRRVLKPTGNLLIFCAENFIGTYHGLYDHLFDTFKTFIWHKTNPTPQVRKTSFLNSIEFVVCCWDKGHTFNFKKQNEMHNFFESGICGGRERLDHPTQKPLKLLNHLMEICSNEGDIVLDPFMGTASTGESALFNNRSFIGFEKEESYFNLANNRLSKFDTGEN